MEDLRMKDLRRTALIYYNAAPTKTRHDVERCFKDMGPNDNGYVRFKKFSEYVKINGYKNMASREFFEELKQPNNEGLNLNDIVTLFYIIHSGRPFCGGACKKFVKGMYFTCVKCFFDNKNKNEYSTFSVCSRCFGHKEYEHRHKYFLDPIVLLQSKRSEELNNKERGTSTDAAGRGQARRSRTSTPSVTTVLVDPSASRTSSSAIVPAVPRRSNPANMQAAIQFGQLLANLANLANLATIAAASCTIL